MAYKHVVKWRPMRCLGVTTKRHAAIFEHPCIDCRHNLLFVFAYLHDGGAVFQNDRSSTHPRGARKIGMFRLRKVSVFSETEAVTPYI